MVAPSKISEKWECLLIRVSRSYKMATVFGLSPFGFLHWRIFAVGVMINNLFQIWVLFYKDSLAGKLAWQKLKKNKKEK